MTVTIELPPELEASLQQRALIRGQNIKLFVLEAIQEKIAHSRSLDEICAPFAHAVAASGITEDEFDELVDEARAEGWQAKQNPGS